MATDATQESPRAGEMGLPHVESFCCCMGLEAGARTVGILHLIASLSFLVVCSLFAADAGALAGTVEDAGDQLYSVAYKIAVGVAVVTVVHVLLAIALLYAVCKRRVGVVRAYVCIMASLYAAAVLYVALTAALRGFNGTGSDIFLAFLEGVLVFGFMAYCIICVHSYYLMLKSAEDMEGPGKQY